MAEGLIHGDLTYKVIGFGMQVHRTLGRGFLEKVYENSLMVLFGRHGIPAPAAIAGKGHVRGGCRR